MKPRSKSVWMTPAACGRRRADRDRPGADFLRPGGEIALQAEQCDTPRGRALPAPALRGPRFRAFRCDRRRRARPARLRAGRRRRRPAPFGRGALADLFDQRAFAVQVDLVDVGDVEHGLGGDQLTFAEDFRRLRPSSVDAADRVACGEPGLARRRARRRGPSRLCRRCGRSAAPVASMPSTACRSASISSVSMVSMSRIGSTAPFDVDDVGVVEAADDVQNGVDVADVGQELVAQAFALRRAADDAGDVDQLQDGRDDLLRFDELVDRGQPLIGDGDDADVGLDRAERVVLLAMPAAVSALKSVLLPTFGSPTIPASMGNQDTRAAPQA